MSDEAEKGNCCCALPIPGLRMLTFPDGTKAGVMGLNEILAAVYAEGRQANTETAEEIVERLAGRNYIAPSSRPIYRDLLMEEYRHYVRNRVDSGPKQSARPGAGTGGREEKGLLARLLKKAWIPPHP